ncbi:hypothetical protein VB737_05750 [Synechococcus sp. BA-120 BA3]|nr:hypothetical protein [Synechococcus sp. BA-120 BA3]
MNLNELLIEGTEIASLDAISFKSTPLHYVRVSLLSGETFYIINEMVELSNGTEGGVLICAGAMKSSEVSDPELETFSGGKISSATFLSMPGSKAISAIRFALNGIVCTVASGDAPYSLFLKHGQKEIGTPEYPISDYVEVDT